MLTYWYFVSMSQDFCKEVDMHFHDHMRGRGTSLNFADLASDPPPQSLQVLPDTHPSTPPPPICHITPPRFVNNVWHHLPLVNLVHSTYTPDIDILLFYVRTQAPALTNPVSPRICRRRTS